MNIYWLAGLLEGEGSFLCRDGRLPVIQCAMTDKDVIEKIKDGWNGSVYNYIPKNINHKPSWQWVLRGNAALSLMKELHPFMGERRKTQIDSVIQKIGTRLQDQDRNRELVVSKHMDAGMEYLNGGGSLRKIAKRYGVSQVTVLKYSRLIKEKLSPVVGT